jgi:transcriptional regulator GlxA family with amidase domain
MDEIARHVGLASSRFDRAFRSATRQSPKQMLAQMRLERASEMLLMTNLTLEEVGAQAGMPCIRSFRRAFSAVHGITPARLRQVRDRLLAQ